ncbi:MAG: cob(I)yrinic acid a,c-diamide adenosyltransferase [Oligoflexales bacterium]|nr:cob(I)yrinic acid a,c-diamide adenosyltransferase [Oligoflexales bacterium]
MENDKRGLILVNTGDGKGKTTAAFGTVFRALGHGHKCCIIQFLKKNDKTGEIKLAKTLANLDVYTMGRGFTWESEDLEKDRQAAIEAWNKAKQIISSDKYDLVVLDEITYTFHYNFLNIHDFLDVLEARPSRLSVIITGRGCPQEIVELSDLTTEMKNIKHPYEKGVSAQKGLDY